MSISANDALAHISILNFSLFGTSFTFDGHTCQMFISNDSDFRFGGPDYKPSYGGDGLYYNDDGQWTGTATWWRTYNTSMWYLGAEDYWITSRYDMVSGLRIARDISGLDFIIPGPGAAMAWKTANPGSIDGRGLLNKIDSGYCDPDYEGGDYTYTPRNWFLSGTSGVIKKFGYQLSDNYSLLLLLDLNNPEILGFQNMLKFGNIRMYRTAGNLVIE